MKRLRLNDTSTCPAADSERWQKNDVVVGDTAMVTGRATSTIQDPRRCIPLLKICPDENPYRVALRGANFSCADWSSRQGAQFVIPLQSLDEKIVGTLVRGDVAQVLRLTQKPQ
jgi:hypothetical protein